MTLPRALSAPDATLLRVSVTRPVRLLAAGTAAGTRPAAVGTAPAAVGTTLAAVGARVLRNWLGIGRPSGWSVGMIGFTTVGTVLTAVGTRPLTVGTSPPTKPPLVGAAVGALLGAAVGTLLGAAVGDLVGAAVGAAVGALLGAAVGACSKRPGETCQGLRSMCRDGTSM